MNIQENHCQKLYDNYQILLKFVRGIKDSGCDLINDNCRACDALDVLLEVGEA